MFGLAWSNGGADCSLSEAGGIKGRDRRVRRQRRPLGATGDQVASRKIGPRCTSLLNHSFAEVSMILFNGPIVSIDLKTPSGRLSSLSILEYICRYIHTVDPHPTVRGTYK